MSVSSIPPDPTGLVGRWRMSRLIEDRLDGDRSTLDGRLLLSEETPGRIRWLESGQWHRPGGDVEVSRALWLVHEQHDGWWVLFDDGRAFHPYAPGRRFVHDCSPDTYRGVVEGTTQSWTVRWEVSGPHKDYTMTTTLCPED